MSQLISCVNRLYANIL